MKKLGIVTGRPYRQSIALAVSLAQAQNGQMPTMSAGSPGSRTGSVGPDDDDSMDVHHNLLHHHLQQQQRAMAAAGHFRRRANSLEELSLYFSPAAAAAAAAAELALAQNRPASAEADEDDAGSAGSGIHPAPMDLSQNYERIIRPASGVDAEPPTKSTELLAEKSV